MNRSPSLVLRLVSTSLAAWMAVLPGVATAASLRRTSVAAAARNQRLAERVAAAVSRMRAETGADPEKLKELQKTVVSVENAHLGARLAGLAHDEEGLRAALDTLNHGTVEEAADAQRRMQAHLTSMGAAAGKLETLRRSGVALGGAEQILPLMKKIAATTPKAHGPTTARQLGKILQGVPPPRAKPFRQAPPGRQLTVVTPRTAQASREETRLVHPLLASADAPFRVATTLAVLDEGALSPPVAADLNATPEAPLTPALKALATQLNNDPVAIYSYVRNSVRSEPYAGSKKGALGTLAELSGNDTDQASLLIALLRSAGIYARYETGKVILSTRQAMEFTDTEDVRSAVTVMDTIGMVAVANIGQDNNVDSVTLDQHVWVRAYVPYTNYRGPSAPGSQSVWVRLDPSLKPLQRTPPAATVASNVTFDFNGYLSGTTPQSTVQSPLQIYEGQMMAYAQANGLSCDSLDKLMNQDTVAQVALDMLPSELGAQFMQSEAVADALDPSTAYSLTVQIDNGYSPVINLASGYGQSIALRYVGSSSSDQQAIATAGSTLSVSPIAVTLQPALEIGGVVQWLGDQVSPGTPQVLTVTVNVTGLPQAIMSHDIVAGGVYALGVATGHPTDAQLSAVKSQISAAKSALALGTATSDDVDEAKAQAAAFSYLHHIDRDERRIFGYNLDLPVKDVTEVLAGHTVTSTSFLGVPVSASAGPWRIDVGREANTPMARSSSPEAILGANTLVATNELAGFQGSHWENRLFQEIFDSLGVSTTNGCQLAVAGGGSLLTLTLPGDSSKLVGYSSASVSEIEGALGVGQVVTVPKAPFTSGTLQNVETYLLLDPNVGTGVFREGSVFNGGECPCGSGGPTTNGAGCQVCSGSNQQTNSFTNLANGNYFFTKTDLALPAVGPPVAFTRAYDSGSGVSGVLGGNWWHNYERKLISNADGTVTYVTGEGQLIQHLLFTVNSNHQFVSPSGWNLTLATVAGGGWTLTYKDGRSSSYDNNGFLLSDQDLNANKLTVQRNPDNTVKTVTDASARVALTFAYTGGLLTSVTDAAARVVHFTQTNGDLTSVKDVLGFSDTYGYDGSHHLTAHTDKNGNAWAIAYDGDGRWDQETDPTGNTMSASYDNAAKTTDYTDRRGQSRVTVYDPNGHPLSVTDPSGNTSTMTWDANGNKVTQVDARGNKTRYFYDALGNITTLSNPDNSTYSYAYGPNSRLTQYSPPEGTTFNTYDANGNLKTSKDPSQNTTNYAYNANGTLKTVTLPGNTNPSTYAYNADGTVSQITDPTNAITKFGYDAAGHLTSLTDPGVAANKRSMTVDATGHVLTMTDALLNKSIFTYDPEGNRQTSKDPSLAVTAFTYDALNRLSTVTDAQSNLTRTTYDAEGNVLARSDALGNSTRYTYDEGGRLTSSTDALGNSNALGYCGDLKGSPCQEVDPNGNVTTRKFDSMGRALSVTDADGRTTATTYDTSGRVTQLTDPRGGQISYSYAGNHLSSVYDGYVNVIYGYDANSNRNKVTLGSAITLFTYDANNRLLTEQNPLNQTTTYTYNPDGTRATRLDGNNHKTTYGYDANKRLTLVTFADGSFYAFDYDTRGHRKLEQSAADKRTLVYDSVGRLQTVNDGLTTKTITYGYDAAGHETSLTFDGLTYGYAYDPLGRLISASDPSGVVTQLAYDPAGRRTQLVAGNGVNTAYTYDAANHLTQVNSTVNNHSYTYDAAGNPASHTLPSGVRETYAYDTANDLTGVSLPDQSQRTYGYDASGNRSSMTWQNPQATTTSSSSYTPNGFNQVSSYYYYLATTGQVTNYTFTYDNDGNRLTQKVAPPGSPPPPVQTTTYTWNEDDRLIGVLTPSGQNDTFTYDANGIRVGKHDSAQNVSYLIDPKNQSILATYDAVHATRLATYLQNPQKVDEVLSFTQGASTYYPHTDLLGSVYTVTDSTGTSQATWTYDVYGARTQVTGTLVYPFGFTGREHDVDTGLIYSRQRYYDPSVGSWLQPDSSQLVNMKDGPNLYQYVSNQPSIARDPTGLGVDLLSSDPEILADYYFMREAGGPTGQMLGDALDNMPEDIILMRGAFGGDIVGETRAFLGGVAIDSLGTNCPSGITIWLMIDPTSIAQRYPYDESDILAHEARHAIDFDKHGMHLVGTAPQSRSERRADTTEVLYCAEEPFGGATIEACTAAATRRSDYSSLLGYVNQHRGELSVP